MYGIARIIWPMFESLGETRVAMNPTAAMVVIWSMGQEVQAGKQDGSDEVEHHAEQCELGPAAMGSPSRRRKTHAHRRFGTVAHELVA